MSRPASVEFSLRRLLVPGPNGGSPIRRGRFGVLREPGHSPYMRIRATRIVCNAPILYSPLWDIQEAHRTDAAVLAGQRRIVTDANENRRLSAARVVTSPGRTQLRSNRACLNCRALSFLHDPPAGGVAPAPPSLGAERPPGGALGDAWRDGRW